MLPSADSSCLLFIARWENPMSIRLARLDEQNINVNPTAPAK